MDLTPARLEFVSGTEKVGGAAVEMEFVRSRKDQKSMEGGRCRDVCDCGGVEPLIPPDQAQGGAAEGWYDGTDRC